MLKTSSVTRVGLSIDGAIVGVFLSDLIHAPTLRLCNEADFQNGLAERPGSRSADFYLRLAARV